MKTAKAISRSDDASAVRRVVGAEVPDHGGVGEDVERFGDQRTR